MLTAIVIGAGMRGTIYAQYAHLYPDRLQVNEEDCREIVQTCKDNSVTLVLCHVLRYTPWAQKLRELIDSGVIGEVVNINHTEGVGCWFFAHCFVRGNWHIEADSSSSLLTKCCHDVDLINYWMAGRRCTNVTSFGYLSHFNKKDKPPGSASRCIDCPPNIESLCHYSAMKIYLDQVKQADTGFPVSVITEEPTIESVTTALKTWPYGVCVYDNDNDVMSNQVVNMQFEGGASATLTMIAFTSSALTRDVKIYGTKGQLSCVATDSPVIKHADFLTGETHEYPAEPVTHKGMAGHGGADFYCMHSFVKSLANENPADILTGPEESLRSHLIVFAAEKARKENRVVSLQPEGNYNCVNYVTSR